LFLPVCHVYGKPVSRSLKRFLGEKGQRELG
jgi:hypothetical protein